MFDGIEIRFWLAWYLLNLSRPAKQHLQFWKFNGIWWFTISIHLTRGLGACCYSAQIFNIYPRKGAILPGSDADLIIFNPNKTTHISAKTHHSTIDTNIYEGWTLQVIHKPCLEIVWSMSIVCDIWVSARGMDSFEKFRSMCLRLTGPGQVQDTRVQVDLLGVIVPYYTNGYEILRVFRIIWVGSLINFAHFLCWESSKTWISSRERWKWDYCAWHVLIVFPTLGEGKCRSDYQPRKCCLGEGATQCQAGCWEIYPFATFWSPLWWLG